MGLFQQAVLNKYLSGVADEEIEQPWEVFTSHFHDPEIQENIRNSKEEEYQSGFLTDLFVNVLGYTKYPASGHNLKVEQRDEKGSKKADGALYEDEKVKAVIELKGTDTTDLDKVEPQAFGYKNYHRHANYVIISNFEKLRFYIDNAVEHIEFNLFELTKEEFKILWLCLAQHNIIKGLPKTIKDASLTQNEEVTKKLYADYSAFKDAIFQSIVKHNPGYDKLRLFKKTQKLLDRFLFIFFAEDQQLLPPNSIKEIIKQWQQLKELDEYRPLYERFIKYFGYLNTGHKGKSHEIFPYNGGLFAEDEILDSITIEDELLYKHALQLSRYDFASEVDVNILGHIFEHSLNEIEEITAELEGQEVDTSKTRRKKDGVFYTPKYITQYIVENTVGKLCEEKKAEMEIDDEEYRPNRQKKTKKELLDKLETYREWLLTITICDPACGSGAFLNQALEFLIEEHHYIDELQAKLLDEGLIISDIESSILENNLFGVDINEESVEIAKLSLWLRTAQKGRKLTSLNNNIKCGNSLIDDPDVTGDKAFNWEEEFSSVFEDGGFDVVIGNPPYVRAELLGDFRDYFEQHYEVYHSASDLFAYFYEKGSKLIKPSGLMAYISNTFDKTTAGKVLRKYLTNKTTFQRYVDFTEVQVFDGATTYPVIIILNQEAAKENEFAYVKIPKDRKSKVIEIDAEPEIKVLQSTLDENSWAFLNKEKALILSKLEKLPTVKEKYGKSYRGLITGLNKAFIIEKDWPLSEHLKFLYEGKEIKKWHTPTPEQKLILFESGWTKETYGEDLSEEEAFEKVKNDYPKILEHLLPFEKKAKKRYDQGEYWWELRNCAYYDLFEKPKIIFPNLQNSNKFCFDERGVYINAPAVFLPTSSKTLLCILNSTLVWEFLLSICVVRSGGYVEVKPQYFEQIPIPEFKNEDVFEKKADRMIELTSELQTVQKNLRKLLLSKFDIEKLSRKLENWHELTFKQFLKELKKKKVTLALKEEAEWMEYFNEQKAKADELKSQIDQTDREIDAMVYELYGLGEEEIGVVEGD